MRSMLRFGSLIALGLISASALAIVGAGTLARAPIEASHALGLDYGSLLVGLVLGLILSSLARIAWGEVPRRMLAWLWRNERNIYRGAFALLLLAVLIFY